LFNADRYSNSTTKQSGIVLRAMPPLIEIIYVSTLEIRNFVDNPNVPLIIIREEQPKELNSIMELLRDFCKSHGMKRFQMQKFKKMTEMRIVAENL
jgi:hypothetical protein